MTSSSIVKDGRLTVPLFHGTSSRFHDSIYSAGLGGRNIVEDMGLRKAARTLMELSADCSQDDWLCDVSACMHIAADPAKHRLGTLRYGGTYLSACRETAANYALLYPVGGEALSHIIRLYKRLSSIKPDLDSACEEFAGLVELAAMPASPILVEARDAEVTALRSDCGGSIEDTLARMEALIGDECYDMLVGQHNFELTRAIPSAQLRFFEVRKVMEYDGEGGSREILQFTPFKPA